MWEFLYERSVGCVGILKEWLMRACVRSIRHGAATLSREHLEKTALSISQCEKILAESREGETRLNDNEDSRLRLRTLLALNRNLVRKSPTETPVRSRPSGTGRRKTRSACSPGDPIEETAQVICLTPRCKAWELSVIDSPAEAIYIRYPPSAGTPTVESLTGYIHGSRRLTPWKPALCQLRIAVSSPLYKRRAVGRASHQATSIFVYIEAHSLNGPGDRARLWTSALEELTGVQRLDLLTALPWANAIRVHLLRTSRAWCSSCYESRRSSGQPVYEPLLWVFQVVTVCP